MIVKSIIEFVLVVIGREKGVNVIFREGKVWLEVSWFGVGLSFWVKCFGVWIID